MLIMDSKWFIEMWQHAVEAYPEECCGILLGIREEDQRRVSHVFRSRNVHPSPTTNYSIDPGHLIDLQRRARDMRVEILGFYHSHPDHPPYYSETDLNDAHWDDCAYIIFAVENGEMAEARAFVLQASGGNRALVGESWEVL